MIRLDSRSIITIFFVLLATVFGGTFPYIGVIANPNENTRTYTTMALVEDHTFHIDKKMAEFGLLADVALVQDPDGSSHYDLIKGPANTYAGVPVYWAMRKLAPLFGYSVPGDRASHEEHVHWLRSVTFVLRFFTVQIPCFIFLIWAERWLRSTTRDVVLRLSAVLAVGCGTNYLAYSLMFASHALVGVASLLAFGITADEWRKHKSARSRSLRAAFLVGLCAGWAVALEYQAVVVSFVLVLFAVCVFRRPAQIAALIFGGAINTAGVMIYQYCAFGNAWTPGHHFDANKMQAIEHSVGVFGIGTPRLRPFLHLCFSNAFGFFGTSPFMWLGAVAIPCVLFAGFGSRRARSQRRIATIVWAAAALLLFLAISGKPNWRAGWTIGPRYFGAVIPFFGFGAVAALEWVARKSPTHRTVTRAVSVGLALASVVQTGLVSMIQNTLDDAITRPLAEVALPLLITGFAPHHIFELVGWTAATPFYLIVGCLALAAFLVVVVRTDETFIAWCARFVGSLTVAIFALIPAFGIPGRKEGDHSPDAVAWLTQHWEPSGRDAITAARSAAEGNSNDPCAWLRLAKLERLDGWTDEAKRDSRRASGDSSSCDDGGSLESLLQTRLSKMSATTTAGHTVGDP